jgi:hypothetical protein
MDKYEDYLLKHYGRENSFKVPEGYFEDFAEKIMSQLPEQKAQVVELHTSWTSRLRKMVAAAIIAVVAGGGAYYVFSGSNDVDKSSMAHSNITPTESQTIDQMADYTMMDNADMYAALTEY